MKTLKEFAYTAAVMSVSVIISLGVYGIVGSMAPDVVPGMGTLLLVVCALVAAFRGAKSPSVLAVAAGAAVPVVLMSVLSAITLVRNVPGVDPHPVLFRGTVATGVVALLIGALAASVGKVLYKKVFSSQSPPD